MSTDRKLCWNADVPVACTPTCAAHRGEAAEGEPCSILHEQRRTSDALVRLAVFLETGAAAPRSLR